MGRAEFTVKLDELENLAERFKDPAIQAKLQGVASMPEVAAMVAQAIADNFAQEGPGWDALKGATIRNSVAKGMLKNLIKDAYFAAAFKVGAVKVSKSGKRSIDREALRGKKKKFYEHVDKQLVDVERAARKSAGPNDALGNRQILRRTSLLYKTVTTPGFAGSSIGANEAQADPDRAKLKKAQTGKTVTGANIYRVQGTNLIWGTNLIYAATHNEGDEKRHIPKREFLVIRDEWQRRLNRFVFRLMSDIVKNHVEGK